MSMHHLNHTNTSSLLFLSTSDDGDNDQRVATSPSDMLLQQIQTDLMYLLNHQRIPFMGDPKYAHIDTSILYYGLPDLTPYNPLLEQDRLSVRSLLKRAIINFEPRLKNVYILDEAEKYQLPSLMMHFHITAEIACASTLTPVAFESVIETPRDEVIIKSAKIINQ